MAPPVGLEPTTHGLTVRCSTDWAKGALCWHYLSSRQVTLQVLSAQMSLTSVFGMGTGGPSSQSTPTRTKSLENSVLKTRFQFNRRFSMTLTPTVRASETGHLASDTPWKLNKNEWSSQIHATEPAPSFVGQAFGLLVSVSLTPYDAYTPDLSTT